MNVPELLRWQWEGYPRAHGNPVNLWLHVLTVPFFWAGSLFLLLAMYRFDWHLLLLGLGCMLVTLVAQGRGHKMEANPPAPFTGPWNFIARLFLEQWITFPRFLLSGGWGRKLAAGRRHAG